MKMLGPLTAEQQLRGIQVISVPHMKQDAIDRLISRLERRARGDQPQSVSEQLMKAMRVVYEPKKVTDVG